MSAIQWPRVVGSALTTWVVLVALGWADSVNHYVLAMGANLVIGLVWAAVSEYPASDGGEEG